MNIELGNRVCPAGLGRGTIKTANLPPELRADVTKCYGEITGWCEGKWSSADGYKVGNGERRTTRPRETHAITYVHYGSPRSNFVRSPTCRLLGMKRHRTRVARM
jgi:hypothetical protein